MPDGTTDYSPEPELTSAKAPPAAKGSTDPTARFPYAGLEEATLVARAVFEHGASALSPDQLAATMKMAPDNSTFQVKLGAARMFGLLKSYDGKLSLTGLGERICSADEHDVKRARAEAFLHVPLYSRTYTEFRGKQLPPSPLGIEERFVSFGVTPKQKDKARRAFENSAQFAGFFAGGKDRLIEPILGASAPAGKPTQETKDDVTVGATSATTHSTSADPIKEPLIHGLLIRLPPPGTEWPLEKRVQWLRVLAGNLNLVYATPEPPDNETRFIDIKIESI